MRTLALLGTLALVFSIAAALRRGRNGKRHTKPLAGLVVGSVAGAITWPVAVIFCAVMSHYFDTEIDSDTIIFHGWGAATILSIFLLDMHPGRIDRRNISRRA